MNTLGVGERRLVVGVCFPRCSSAGLVWEVYTAAWSGLRAQGRLAMAQNLPKGPIGRSNQWIVIFQAGVNPADYLTGSIFSEEQQGPDDGGQPQEVPKAQVRSEE